MTETRTVQAYVGPGLEASLLSWHAELSPADGKDSVTLTGSCYYGLGMRFVESMDGSGQYLYAADEVGPKVQGESRLTRSKWVAYVDSVDGRDVTVALFDHPENPRHPASMYTKPESFAYLSATLDLTQQPFAITADEPLVLRYGSALWDGEVDRETIEQMYSTWLELEETQSAPRVSSEGQLMVAAARKYERVFQTGTQQRSNAANIAACQLVRDGHLGKMLEVIGYNYPSPWQCNFRAQSPPAGLDWNAWCGQTPLRPYHEDIYAYGKNPGWISFRDFSGGQMTAWGAHGLDQVQSALGTDETGPVEIWTEGERFRPPVYSMPESRERGQTICSQPEVWYRYASGVTLRLVDGPMGGAVFIGERGKITVDRGRFRIEPEELSRELLGDVSSAPGATEHHLQNWIDCIKSREKPSADVEIGHRSVTLCHLGNIGRWTGRKLRWDPQEETFSNDDEANALTARIQREPYQLPEEL